MSSAGGRAKPATRETSCSALLVSGSMPVATGTAPIACLVRRSRVVLISGNMMIAASGTSTRTTICQAPTLLGVTRNHTA